MIDFIPYLIFIFLICSTKAIGWKWYTLGLLNGKGTSLMGSSSFPNGDFSHNQRPPLNT